MFARALVFGLMWGAAAQADCAQDPLLIESGDQTHRFEIQIADDTAERQRGLMFVEQMDSDAGMLFVFGMPQPASFWMRNTLIPLDMLFADSTGQVTRIHRNAIPLDETPIEGGDNILYVLEINGGLSEKLGLREGDYLVHPGIDKIHGDWTCE